MEGGNWVGGRKESLESKDSCSDYCSTLAELEAALAPDCRARTCLPFQQMSRYGALSSPESSMLLRLREKDATFISSPAGYFLSAAQDFFFFPEMRFSWPSIISSISISSFLFLSRNLRCFSSVFSVQRVSEA